MLDAAKRAGVEPFALHRQADPALDALLVALDLPAASSRKIRSTGRNGTDIVEGPGLCGSDRRSHGLRPQSSNDSTQMPRNVTPATPSSASTPQNFSGGLIR